ncbi:MAG TPA: ABC transporter permease, partial [Ignavibacteria bacterium]|nr:ABC transporter permease [Ignavibacteria bacterium]
MQNKEKYRFAVWNVMKRELGRISRNKTIYSLSIFFPIFLFTLLSFIYKDGVVREIPVVVCDRDHSSLSDSYCQLIESDGAMKIVKYVASLEDIENAFKNGGIYAGIYIPDNFESDIKKGISTSVVIYNNSLNIITNNTVLKSGKTFTKSFSGAILLKKLRSKGLPEDEVMNIINKVTIDTQSLYNPNYNYLDYLIPGLVPSMLQMLIMVVAVLLLSSEFTHGTFADLLETSRYRIGALILGKSIPHIAIHTITAIGILAILFPLFGISGNGSMLLSIGVYFIFVCASFFMGMAISALVHDQYLSTEVALFLNTPAFIFSGFV